MAEKVASLEEMGLFAPLSVGAAIATVKRYIAEPRFRIWFNDLLVGEARRVRERHAAEYRPDERPYDAAAVRKRLLGYDTSTEVLRNMLFEASRWPQPEHYDTILRAISALVPSRNNGGIVG